MRKKELLLALRFKELVQDVASRAGVTQIVTEKVIRHTFIAIKFHMINGNPVQIPKFGNFCLTKRNGRITKLPGQAHKIWIRDRYYPKCSFSSKIKLDLRNKKDDIERQQFSEQE